MKVETSRDSARWWEFAARTASLELPASIAAVPGWVLVDGETRRLVLGPDVRKVGVGAGWTARVILAEMQALSPLSEELLHQVLDPAMEGPLWLDLWPTGISLEGAISGWREDLAAWMNTLHRVIEPSISGFHSVSGSVLQGLLPGSTPGGIVVWLGGVPHLTAVVQVDPLFSADGDRFVVALGTVASLCGLSEDESRDLAGWYQKAAQGAKWFQLAFPVGRRGVTLRAWYVPASLALDLAGDAGCDEEAARRSRSLLELAHRQEFAWLELGLRPGEPPRLRMALDLGLMAY